MTDSAPDTHGLQDHADPPALAATVEVPVTWNDADRDAGIDWWIATCNYWHEQADNRERLRQLSVLHNEQLRADVDELTAQRDQARSIAAALEAELALRVGVQEQT